MSERIRPTDQDVLMVVDVQNDFCPGGALAVPDGDRIVPLVNRLMDVFPHVLLTQDWHTPGHSSFASAHPGKEPFQSVQASYGQQVLWPDHCVQGTAGAAFHPELDVTRAELIVRKGFHREIDSYSAFYENDHTTSTGLAGYLRERGFRRVYLCGLATDFCVKWSAVDARREGFEVSVIEDACRAIDLEGSLEAAKTEIREAEVSIITSDAFSA